MSNNIFKGSFIQFSSENTRVIDSSALFAKRIEENSSVLRAHEEEEFNASYDEEGNLIENVDEFSDDPLSKLTEDYDGDNGEISSQNGFSLSLDEVRAECDEMLDKANREALEIREDALNEANSIKQSAKEEGFNEGYEEGKNQAFNEIEAERESFNKEKEELINSYNEMVKNIEERMVDVIANVYEHVFGENFFNKRDVMIYLINKALLVANTADKVVIHVSFDDYDMLMNRKAMIFDRTTFTEEPDIKPREDLLSGQAKIETPFGIMDCSIDTELRELSKTLRIMSRGEAYDK